MNSRRTIINLLLISLLFLFISCETENNVNYNINTKIDLSSIMPKAKMELAVLKAPIWLRGKLIAKLNSLKPLEEDKYPTPKPNTIPENVTNPKKYFVDYILSIKKEDILDEVIFQVATTPNPFLVSFNYRDDLFIYNARYIYNTAKELNYVEIVEKEQYTTLKYKIDKGDGTIEEKEIPYFYYYNYVLPLLIDDNKAFFMNRLGKFSEEGKKRDDGKLWKSYLYNSTKGEAKSLKELLSSADVLWRNKTILLGHYKTEIWENAYPDKNLTLKNQDELVTNFLKEAYDNQGAIGSIIEWMMKNMIFGAKGKRPIEPSEIYAWGRGNCGEWGDLTAAALRASLIPATVISVSIDDHVWNEFYDGSWHNIEPYHPFVGFDYYDKEVAVNHEESNGWWSVHIASRARHDGLMENVTARYSGYGNVNLTVKDKNGNPIDNAIVLLYGQGDLREEGQLGLGGIAYTNVLGESIINLGDTRKFWGRVITPLGTFPIEESEVRTIVEKIEADGEYNWDVIIDGEKPIYNIEKIDEVKKENTLTLNYSLDNLKSYTNGYNIWHGARFLKENEEVINNLDVMILTSTEYEKFINKETVSTSYLEKGKDNGSFNISLNLDEELYVIVSNKNNLSTSFFSNLKIDWIIGSKAIQTQTSEIYLKSGEYFVTSFKLNEK